ncbi:hypothetical protein BDV28DRAFT_146823 [Aspergillus coremiiformis]|uniref:DNA recombination and repair protein Rad51-like C-terminal domain-containing protein n=1 Tax=Aspergillus coremiiformis TaxID=138285 RepID=A0A5N6ZAM8_9EURO|nr:hypothetical protein BDV28DRAFT_146823 [Aspergillus coremiiformis]
MAASFGEKLLGEVYEEGLDELLHDLNCFVASSNHTRQPLGIQALDDLLGVFIPSPASLLETQAHHQPPEPMVTADQAEQEQVYQEGPPIQPQVEHDLNTYPREPVHPPVRIKSTDPVVEISSTSSGAGKTQTLYYLTAVAILPSEFNGVKLDGRESAVIFIDVDGRFDAGRLMAVTRRIVCKKFNTQQENAESAGVSAVEQIPGYSQEDLDTLLVTSLQHVHVFRPQSSPALLSTLQSMDTYLLDLTRHLSSTRPLHAIIIDSASAFFWQDKLHDEVARTEDIGRPYEEIECERREKKSFYLFDMYADLVAELKRLQRLFSCAVVYTTIAWSGRSMPDQMSTARTSGPFALFDPSDVPVSRTPSFRSSLPGPWGAFPTLRLVVQREMVRPFPPAMTVHEAQREAPMRQEVVMKGRFVGWVNGWGREDWPRRVLEGLDDKNGGMFGFSVGTDGVDFD